MNDMETVYKAGHKIEGIRLSAHGALQLWRQHCAITHADTRDDYRVDVVLWHRGEYPDCGWDIGSWHWNDDVSQWAGTDGIER